MHIVNRLETSSFKDERLPLFLKASRIQRPFKPRVLAHLYISLLDHIIKQCNKFQFPVVFKPLYLLMFFFFLRLSNVLPHSVAKFDYTRQLARADVIFGTTGAILLIKWSKIMQNRRDFATISLPDLAGSHLCPVIALKVMFQRFPGSDNSPVFVIPRLTGLVTLTDSVARKHLKDICRSLGLDIPLTIHDFRRSGTAWAFQHGVPLEHIMKHGTCKSDAIWTFLCCHCCISCCLCISTGLTALILLGFVYLLSSPCTLLIHDCQTILTNSNVLNVKLRFIRIRNLEYTDFSCWPSCLTLPHLSACDLTSV